MRRTIGFAFAFALVTLPATGDVTGSRPEMLRGPVTVRAAGRGNPFINFADGREIPALFNGPDRALTALESRNASPLSLASADFDEDGVPDLVCGFGQEDAGIFTIHRGNVDAIYPNAPEAKKRKAVPKKGAEPELGFTEVNVVGQVAAAHGSALTVALRCGHAVTFEAQRLDLAWLKSVLKVVSAC